jgi:hypothetical protein
MSQAPASSTGQRYGLARGCRVWGLARSTLSWQRHASSAPGARRGPRGPGAADEWLDHSGRLVAASPCPGEGYRQGWARLRPAGIRTSPRRVWRLRRAHHRRVPRAKASRMARKPTMGRSSPRRSIRCGGPLCRRPPPGRMGRGPSLAPSSITWQRVSGSMRPSRAHGLKRWSPSGKGAVRPLERLGKTSRKAWRAGLSMAVTRWRMCFRRS